MVSSTPSKVKTIAEDLNIPQVKVASVLYDYLTWCIQEVLIDGKCRTIFGTLVLDDNDRLYLETDKEGLIGLLDKHDVYSIRKVVEQGVDYSIF